MYKELKQCLCCRGSKMFPLLNLGDQPLANSYHLKDEVLPKYPLATNLCLDCFHVQLSIAIDPDLMFKNYLYVSGTTKTLRDYFDWFASYVHVKYGSNICGPKRILDIACNDGSQLKSFKSLGYDVYGVDPAENLADQSRVNGINLTVGYWNKEISIGLLKMDFIVCQNVLAHNDNPLNFLLNCYNTLDRKGKIFIQTSQANMLQNNEFDTIYHEHISFFCAKSMNVIAKLAGFRIEDVLKPEIHGTSYIFVLSKDLKCDQTKIDNMIRQEASIGREDIVFYDNYVKKVMASVNGLKEIIEKYRSQGIGVVGYGAAAKGNTLLNFGNIVLDYIVDDNEMKNGFLTPGMNIEIKSPEELAKEDKLIVVPLAWNFFKEIKGKVEKIRTGKETKFILYFPNIEIF